MILTIVIVFNLIQLDQKRYKRIKGFELIGEVIEIAVFKNGVRSMDQSNKNAA